MLIILSSLFNLARPFSSSRFILLCFSVSGHMQNMFTRKISTFWQLVKFIFCGSFLSFSLLFFELLKKFLSLVETKNTFWRSKRVAVNSLTEKKKPPNMSMKSSKTPPMAPMKSKMLKIREMCFYFVLLISNLETYIDLFFDADIGNF